MSLNLFYHYLTLDSEPCTREEEMLDVFNFATGTELVLNDVFTEYGVMQAATIFLILARSVCPATSEIMIIRDRLSR